MISRSNSVDRLLAGEITMGTFVGISSPATVEILARRGFDPVCIDSEHTALGPELIENMIRAADSFGVAALVRVPGVGPEIGRALDSGALGVVVPRVETPEQAQACVDMVRYPPQGQRGAGPGRSTAFGKDLVASVRESNSSVALILQVETELGLQNAYEIAAVDGVDMIFVGPGDLAVSMGVGMGSEKHTAAVAGILAEVKRAGKLSGIFSLTGGDLPHWRELGATFFLLSGDVSFLGEQAEAERTRVLELLGE
ncbi:HpcH/HpaI aldolase family protein [Micromonospora inyonensis]|uniref:4-hydroxy-2-oxoheptanedioate aldolase n=1 Tax=Micromonospora inyonensis TaxID=47866 RepID=A0A1C6SAW3_9ACTN|nr:aldolase/citrate lyase family protein [Micromonospora inyonensis]SCL26546.1 4-hydroxy-2-oxoheptanedioate aldolase [Micromonospora inyonensis]